MADKKRSSKSKKTGPSGASGSKKPVTAAADLDAKNASQKKSRDERFAEARRQRRRRRFLKNAAMLLVVLIPVGAIVGWAVKGWLDQRNLVDGVTSASCRYDTKSDPGRTGEHLENPPPFAVDPPSGGAHLPTSASAGDYSAATTNLPPDGNLVHALEHGYINVWYKPDIAEADRAALQKFQTDHERDVLLIPRPSQAVPVAATAWQKRLLCDRLELDNLERFTDAYVNEGPEKVPH